MASRLSWLSTCKLSQLKTIANATGINSSGTKPILTSRLLQDLQLNRFSSPQLHKNDQIKTHRIISIDMGIRNLAYCRLALPPNWTTQANPTPPILEDWARLSISQKAPLSNPSPSSTAKESFDPATYSHHAYVLISTLLLPPASPPTHILIERQRFRSMGGSAVQEWTLRVNMFEAMLYAVLKSFQAQGLWSGTVHPVAPGKVTKYWLEDSDLQDSIPATATPSPATKTAKTKTAKIDLVARWLEDPTPFVLSGRTADLGRAYLLKRQGRRKVVAEEKEVLGSAGATLVPAEMGKLDDLADCLLQGMAWIRWEENRRGVLEGGLEALGTPLEKTMPRVEVARGVRKGGNGTIGSVAPAKQGRRKRVGKA